MFWLTLITLILMGLLGIAAQLKSRSPQTAGPLAQLESIEGWVGLVGLVLGLWGLINLILNLGALLAVPVSFVLALVTALAMTGLGLLLSFSVLKQFMSGSAARNVSLLAARVAPFKVILGVICLAVAVWTLLRSF